MLVNDAKQANEMINKVLNITTQNPLVAGEIISCLLRWFRCVIDANFAKQNKIILEYDSYWETIFNVNKILDSYIQEAAAGGGSRYPKLEQIFFNAFEKEHWF
jgi:hypothetical protein